MMPRSFHGMIDGYAVMFIHLVFVVVKISTRPGLM
jgi:hypothetical protein